MKTLQYPYYKNLFSAAGIVLYLLIFSTPAHAVQKPDNEVSWHISALQATFDQERRLFIARGAVIITGGTTRLEADYVEFNNTTKDAHAKGNVLLISGEDTITCNLMDLNLATETGTIYNGTIFVQESNFYIKGNKIEKTGKETYRADKASITSCSGDSPDWKLSGKEIKVTIEGYGTLKHAVLWAKNTPLLYSPYLAFPVKTKRETGFLSPRISSSERKGYEYEQPLFLALTRNSDATIYTDYMEKRGVKTGIEYRYRLSNGSKGAIFYDFLHDRHIGDNKNENKDYSFDLTPARTNSDRYWFRMKHDQIFSKLWSLKLDIDYVSDADYLREFKDGYTGFNATKNYFDDNFGRSLDDYDDTTRENRLNLNKTWSCYSLNMDLNWIDNVIARRDNVDNNTLQTLPAIEFNRLKQRAGDLPFYFDFDSEYRYFYREDTTDSRIKGSRTDFYPRIYLPFRYKSFFLFEPSAGIRETMWYTDEFKEPSGKKKSFHHREIYDIDLELSTEMAKIFNSKNWFAEKIRHEIKPMIKYSYIPEIDQDDLPKFDYFDDSTDSEDAIDEIGRKNLITWSLTNRFTLKKKSVDMNSKKENYIYREFAWFKFYQSFDINKEKDDIEKPFSDISLESEFYPGRYISLEADFKWSPYDNQVTESETGITLNNKRGDRFHTEYRYTRSNLESLYTKIDTVLTQRLSAYFTYEKDLLEHKVIETQIGMILKKQCWSLSLSFKDEPDDKSFAFMINLHGIGEFGTE